MDAARAAGVAISLARVFSGVALLLPAVVAVDRRVFQAINRVGAGRWMDVCFALARPFGTSLGFIAAAALIVLWRWPAGAWFALAGATLAAVKRGLKLWLRRDRPFRREATAVVRLSHAPQDPSSPSGDAARAWYLWSAIMLLFSLTPPARLVMALLAAGVALGRGRSGVHYPLDVWAGSLLGLGWGAAWMSYR